MTGFDPLAERTLSPEASAGLLEVLASACPTRPPQDMPAYSGANWLETVAAEPPTPIKSPYYTGAGCRCCKGEHACSCCGWPEPYEPLPAPEDDKP